MSWVENANLLATELRDEFSRTVTVVPMVRQPNGRPKPDPLRPPVETRAIFDDPMAQDRLNLEEVRVETQTPYFSFLTADMPFDFKQGDHILMDGERYEIGTKSREMHNRTRYAALKVA